MHATPADGVVHDLSSGDVDTLADKTREWFSPRRLRAEEMLLSALREFGVFVVTSQVRQASD